jgi:hypothetical protein
MIDINPQPESKPRLGLEKLGFTQKAFTDLLINAGVLSPEDTVVRWNLNKDFLALDVEALLDKKEKL